MVTLHLDIFDIRSLKTHGSCTWCDVREQEYQMELFQYWQRKLSIQKVFLFQHLSEKVETALLKINDCEKVSLRYIKSRGTVSLQKLLMHFKLNNTCTFITIYKSFLRLNKPLHSLN